MLRSSIIRTFVAVTALLGTLALLPAAQPAAADSGSIVVFAAASLREAFEAAAPAFTKKTGIAVTFDFGGSDALATQIAAGAPVDAFASANETQMRKVRDAGLLASEPAIFARNSLVAIVPKGSGIASLSDLARPGVKVVLAAPSVPVGGYARKALANLDGRAGFGATFSSDVEKNVVSNELDVKAVATKIALGEGDAGIVYVTDVTPAVAAKTASVAFPADANVIASYPIAALKAAPNLTGGRAFVAFVLGEGRAYLKARGYLDP